MGEVTEIAWTDHTFNPWEGCSRVSPGCENCYAEVRAHRFGREWGPDAPRKPMAADYWRGPLKWNRDAAAGGKRSRVFCASLADVFEILPARNITASQIVEAGRTKLFELIEQTTHLDWLLLTKRPQNVMKLVPPSWQDAFPVNVWLGVTAEDQQRADERIPILLDVPARIRFVSHEPALEEVDFSQYMSERDVNLVGVDWIITGGESGPGARPYSHTWAAGVVRQCRRFGAAPFVKQMGSYPAIYGGEDGDWPDGTRFAPDNGPGASHDYRVLLNDKKGGDPAEWPASLRVQEFPQ